MHNALNTPTEPYSIGPDQDSYIAITEAGIVVDQCPADSDVVLWMANYTGHHFLVTSTIQAINMIDKPLPDGDIEVLLL